MITVEQIATWRGRVHAVQDAAPFYDPERDGVTFSLLDQFRACRELARLGLKGVTRMDSSLALVFGGIMHEFLRLYYHDMETRTIRAKNFATASSFQPYVGKRLHELETLWRTENPHASAETLQHLELTLLLAEAVLPTYCHYWREDFDKHWEQLEEEFKIPRMVTIRDAEGRPRIVHTYLRGKVDGVFLLGQNARPWLFETKTKSRIEEGTLADIMPFELQVNIYLHSLVSRGEFPAGVLYNVIRRPALRQKMAESLKQFALRTIQDVKERMDFYFVRMEMAVEKADLDRFEGEFTDLLTDFLEWWYGIGAHYRNSRECENKYGKCRMLEICGRRDYTPYFIRSTVFRELEEI